MSCEPEERPLRADARRNRERILRAAAAELAEGPQDKPLSLDAVASRAGVGPGTLYRRFASREALIEAVYANELERLCASTAELLAAYPPDRALRVWMGHYADFVTAKRGMGEVLTGLVTSGVVTMVNTRTRLEAAAERLLQAGRDAGLLRADVSARDTVAAMVGAQLGAMAEHQREQVDRLLDLLLDGLRTDRTRVPGVYRG